ncbi:MAG: hypothetical protein QUS08_00380, partial [Methanothrix sp.]|nr:hypothetical protein [Methanothrix sp.]
MRNQFIYFTGVLALLAAILAAPAQEITAPVNVTENTTVNATTNATVNETLNLTEALALADMNATSSNTEEQPAQIEPGQDQTASTLGNETSRDEAAGM